MDLSEEIILLPEIENIIDLLQKLIKSLNELNYKP